MTTDPPDAVYRLVGDPSAIERAGLFVAEGRLVVERLIADGRFPVHSIVVTPAAAAAMADVLVGCGDVPVHVCEPAALRDITGFNFHRGCLGLAYRRPSPVTLDDVVGCTRVLALEGVRDPDNVGGLFRTALALGTDAVIIDGETADPLYRKAVRTSMAATLRVPYVRVNAWPDALQALRGGGMRVLALTPNPDATPLDEVSLEPGDRLAVLAGSEGSGLRGATLARADLRVRIPVDPRADSLNVVTAAGIALYALRKKGTAPFFGERP